MNEINKQKRLRDASQMAAEAEKIKAAKESTLSDGREENDWHEHDRVGVGDR